MTVFEGLGNSSLEPESEDVGRLLGVIVKAIAQPVEEIESLV